MSRGPKKGVKILKKWVSYASGITGRSLGLILLLIIWEIAPRAGWVNIAYISPPSKVFQALVALLNGGDLWVHTANSLKRALAGLGAAVLIGTVCGIFIGWFRRVEYALDFTFQTFRQMSAFALFPIFILLFGIGEVSKIVIVFWACLWPVLLNTINGVRNVDHVLIDSAKSMGASHTFIFTKVVLPAAAPAIFTGIRLGGSYAIMAIVAAEMIGAHSGLGYLVLYSQETFKIPEMYAAIVSLAVMGLGLNYFLAFLESRAAGWKRYDSADA